MKRSEAYFILVATFIVIVVWIVFSILDSAVSSTISKGLSAQTSPIKPSFNTKIIDDLKKRRIILPENPQIVIATSSARPVSFEIQDPRPTTPPATTSSSLQQGATP